MLCCAELCCAVLCCVVLCCAVLCCAVLCCAVLCCAVLDCVVLTCFQLYDLGAHVNQINRLTGSALPSFISVLYSESSKLRLWLCVHVYSYVHLWTNQIAHCRLCTRQCQCTCPPPSLASLTIIASSATKPLSTLTVCVVCLDCKILIARYLGFY